MSLRSLPEPRALARPKNFQWDAPSDVLARWAEAPLAAASDDANTITIYDEIGEDYWTGGGFTVKRASAALRSIGSNPVTVNINSPGGDMFEGIAIYNLFRQHPAAVTVNIVGWAASAASVIAMAGDEIRMGLGSFIMIHNAWGGVVGNQHDFREAADLFAGFDGALADIYEARTGMKRAEIEKLMDADTFMGPTDATKRGFADSIADDLVQPEASAKTIDQGLLARRRMEAALARAGISRGDRHQMIAALGGRRDATPDPAARDAGTLAALRGLIETMKA